jgi:hypothetical protein
MSGFASEVFDAEARISQQAYILWEADGQPDGQHLEHWERARRAHHANSIIGAALPSTNGYYEGGVSAQPPVL